MEASWIYCLSSGDFYLELREATLRRLNFGACSTYVDQELLHLALAHALEKSYRSVSGDTYEISIYKEKTEEKRPKFVSFTGPIKVPTVRATRNLGIFLGENSAGVKQYGVACYDDETISFALPNGEVLFMWRASFNQAQSKLILEKSQPAASRLDFSTLN